MKVSVHQPYQIIYSLYSHEYLGYLFESFVVQLNEQGRLTLLHQNISSKNAQEFSKNLDETDFKLIKLMDAIQQITVVKKFAAKKISPADFFLKVFDPGKGDKVLQQAIEDYIEFRKAQILELLQGKRIFETGKDGEPAWREIFMAEGKAKVLFHFRRNADNTHYFPSIRHNGIRVEFQNRNAMVICNNPAWLLTDSILYSFEKDLDGNKLKPFLSKKFIMIPRKMEEKYFKTFVAPLVAGFDVYARGFDILSERYRAEPILTVSEQIHEANGGQKSLFDKEQAAQVTNYDGAMLFDLSFKYGDFLFSSNTDYPSYVKVEKKDDSYLFHKIKRSIDWEKGRIQTLNRLGLEIKNGKALINRNEAFHWLNEKSHDLVSEGFVIRQSPEGVKRYFLGRSSISIEISETNDWFDIRAIIRFGQFEIPFLKLRDLILTKKREFILPSGETAVIPEAWFARYSEIFAFIHSDEEERHRLKRIHIGLVRELEAGNHARVVISRKLEQLRDFEGFDDFPLSLKFAGTLRPYQKAGYNWLRFLEQYGFGGCLADDMGLGKTIQTLAFLQHQKESAHGKPNLLILPTSLIYNWESEAGKFTPDLKVFVYTGTSRVKDPQRFSKYDLVITTYGIIRLDIEALRNFAFNYIILDESQAIKNPLSNIARSVKQLNSRNRLILTGTPVENSTLDIWSQMGFINPGLLGTLSQFKNEYLYPIEKKNDEEKRKKLYRVIKPFIIRRTKAQVASELPEKVENLAFCTMSAEQEEIYEKTKSYYRNRLLEQTQKFGIGKSQIFILQGLSKLRQLANHPAMVDTSFSGKSGKLEDIMHKMKSILANDHKILVFSQYVKHLQIVKEELDSNEISYAYLDGSTRNRMEVVGRFQTDPSIKVFLISLKAGGVGLNLTAAEYVFILDPWWNPAVERQAIDRSHRIGQKNTVITYKFISKGTVEEKILLLQNKKQKLASDLISPEESFVKSLSREDINALFE